MVSGHSISKINLHIHKANKINILIRLHQIHLSLNHKKKFKLHMTKEINNVVKEIKWIEFPSCRLYS